jgi:two-component system response regulator
MTANDAAELLMVENNPEDLELALRALRRAKVGNHIQIARDGAEALDYIFCEGKHLDRKIADLPNVILLDLKLPKIDGLEVLKRIKGDPRTQSIPIVVLTSSKQQRDVVMSYELGVNSYILKPVNFERFAEAVHGLGLYWLLMNHSPTFEG